MSTTLSTGGAQRFVSTLLVHLDRAKFTPSLCLMRRDIAYPLPDDVPCEVLEYFGPVHLPRAVISLRRSIARRMPDVVLTNGAATAIVTGPAIFGLNARPRWIARIDNNPVYHDTFIRKLILNRVYPRADSFVVNSHGVLADLEACYPATRGKARAIYNPTDFTQLDLRAAMPPAHRADPGVPLVISVGRLFPQKRIDLLVDAFSLVRKRRKAELWICGDGPERAKIENKIATADLTRSVRVLGHCRNPHALMRQAALYVLTSDYEGLPNSLIEAQGLGLPAVSTRCPHGPTEIIEDGQTGLLTPVGDAGSLAAAIEKLLTDEPRRLRMGRKAELRARKMFAAEPLTREWERTITDCLSAGEGA